MRIAETVEAMVARMTPRERRLFGILVVASVLFVGGGVWFAAQAYVGSIEDDIREARQAIAEIRRLAPKYLEVAAAKAEVERLIRENKATSIRVAANEVLKTKELRDEVPGATGTLMSDVVSFEGKTSETPVGLGKKKKGKARPTFPGLMLVEQKLEFREVAWENLFEFLDEVARGKDLMFVTRLDIARKFNQMSHVRAEVTLATYQFQEKGEGASAEGAAEPRPDGGGRGGGADRPRKGGAR